MTSQGRAERQAWEQKDAVPGLMWVVALYSTAPPGVKVQFRPMGVDPVPVEARALTLLEAATQRW
ncbi:hypothetical protein CCMA1212_000556 [Trichoderma ghanense]|uniref:Uncharacterized protein n=1 Tax=Trichoderma ghanense TaxID=65468 RepID=A0ABY2HDW3_9HYPO